MSHSAARRTYSAEELLVLRRSASDEPALAIQNKTRGIKGMLFLVSTPQPAAFPSAVTIGFSLKILVALISLSYHEPDLTRYQYTRCHHGVP